MRKKIGLLFIACCSATMGFAQGAVEALKYSSTELRGSARYMSMAGAFTALGGDITSVSRNPGAIGVFRNSEISLTLDFATVLTQGKGTAGTQGESDFSMLGNNLGYIGTVRLQNSSLKTLNFGVAYNRLKSFNQRYKVGYNSPGSSIADYVSVITNGYMPLPEELSDKNAYQNPDLAWLSIMGYTSGMITANGTDTQYKYVPVNGNADAAELAVDENGYIDEYDLNVGGNLRDVFYWGLGVGITDFRYRLSARYDERYSAIGQENQGLSNYLLTRGAGVNFKFGFVARPWQYLRIGFAFHTPTYYTMTDRYEAEMYHGETSVVSDGGLNESSYRFESPWRILGGVAVVLGKKGLLSFDYEYTDMTHVRMRTIDGLESESFNAVSGDVKKYYRGVHALKIGGEYRVTNQFSVRAGYAIETSPVKKTLFNTPTEMYTSGTVTNYALPKETHYATAGLGYRFYRFYTDVAYVFRYQGSMVYPYSYVTDAGMAPNTGSLSTYLHSAVLTVGYKF